MCLGILSITWPETCQKHRQAADRQILARHALEAATRPVSCREAGAAAQQRVIDIAHDLTWPTARWSSGLDAHGAPLHPPRRRRLPGQVVENLLPHRGGVDVVVDQLEEAVIVPRASESNTNSRKRPAAVEDAL